jgi:hypothetical protein
MNACLGCEAPLSLFEAFCSPTCEGIFNATTTDECSRCHETFRHLGYTKTGLPTVGCRTCGESFECESVPSREAGA